MVIVLGPLFSGTGSLDQNNIIVSETGGGGGGGGMGVAVELSKMIYSRNQC